MLMEYFILKFDASYEASHLTFEFEKLEEQMIVPGIACFSHTLLTRRLGCRHQPLRNIDCLDKFCSRFLSLLFNAYAL